MPPAADRAELRFDAALRLRIRDRLQRFEVLAHGDHSSRGAAVAVAVVEEGHGAALPGLPVHAHWSRSPALMLTVRSSRLRHHAGQWALPGGRMDEGEDAGTAALRELAEEVGLQVDAADVLGTLDDYVTRSGFVITPVVVWAGPAPTLTPNDAEVESVHRIAIAEFMRADAPLLEASEDAGRQILRMPVGRSWIAAPTAAVLYQFREVCIAGHATRVAHFDQPLFARR